MLNQNYPYHLFDTSYEFILYYNNSVKRVITMQTSQWQTWPFTNRSSFMPLTSHSPYHTRTGYNSFLTVWIDGEAMRYTKRLCSLRGKQGVRFSCLWGPGLPGLVCPFQPLCIAVLLRGWEDCLSKHTTTWRIRGRDWRRHLRWPSYLKLSFNNLSSLI